MRIITLIEVSCQNSRAPGMIKVVRTKVCYLFFYFIVTKQWKHIESSQTVGIINTIPHLYSFIHMLKAWCSKDGERVERVGGTKRNRWRRGRNRDSKRANTDWFLGSWKYALTCINDLLKQYDVLWIPGFKARWFFPSRTHWLANSHRIQSGT